MLKSDSMFRFALWAAALFTVSFFIVFNFGVFVKGYAAFDLAFWNTAPESAGRAGGISTIIVSTLLILAVSLSVAVPISIGAAILLAEYAPRESRIGHGIGMSLDVLAAVPSIVFGLFGNAFFCKFLGLGFSILSGGLTLACMIFPILIRSVEESLRAVTDDFRFGAHALSLSKKTMILKILLPCALPGVFAGVVLGTGRALGETAALIFTSGYVDRMPESLMDSGRALSVHIFDLAMNVAGGETNAYKTAFVLLAIILLTNSIVAYVGKHLISSNAGVA